MMSVRILRQARNASQAQVARAVGISRSHLAMIEAGTRAPSTRVVLALADFFGVTADAILGRSAVRFPDKERIPPG